MKVTTVAELVEQLSLVPQDLEVMIETSGGFRAEISSVHVDSNVKDGKFIFEGVYLTTDMIP